MDLNGRCFKGAVILQSKSRRGVISVYAKSALFSAEDDEVWAVSKKEPHQSIIIPSCGQLSHCICDTVAKLP